MTWQAATREIDVWSTTVRLDVRGETVARAPGAFDRVGAFLDDVDAWFSTFRDDTPVHLIRSGRLAEEDAPAIVRQVLAACRIARDLTAGAFDPWAVPGGVDPSGYVKGWAAARACTMLREAGFANVSVNAGGDVVCRGAAAPGEPWRIGVRHPVETDKVARVVEVHDGAVATSGTYERGLHVIDPATGRPAADVVSATVVGPDGGLADAAATGLVVAGVAGLSWLPRFPGQWSAYVVVGDTATFTGPAFS
ncbi:MAG TPA: FAD:protein FMN transferase [Actinomycetes bacterium]|nr:FAD:protein FMN transferase [Actinomycetes bacterium]